PALRAVAESARQRGFTVEIAGQKLTMQELTTQQGDTIGDLLAQVAALRKEFDTVLASHLPSPVTSRTLPQTDSEGTPIPSVTGMTTPLPSRTLSEPNAQETPPPSAERAPARILWVDDRPKNNSYLVSQLQQLGVTVDQVTSTLDALAAFNNKPYDAIISDMGRLEGSTYNVAAGVEMTRLIRQQRRDMPLIIYCAAQAAQGYGAAALAAGATGVTSSPTELLALLGVERYGTAA